MQMQPHVTVNTLGYKYRGRGWSRWLKAQLGLHQQISRANGHFGRVWVRHTSLILAHWQ